MTGRTVWETIEGTGTQVVDAVSDLIAQGNVRRVRVRQGDRLIAEFPLTVGVVGAVFAPMLAAIGAIVALAANCKIDVEKAEPASAETNSTTPDPEPPVATAL